MIIKNFSMSIKGKYLLKNLNIEFQPNRINHILGKNGVGKSCFAKSIIGAMGYKGEIINAENACIIGSYTNIPLDLKVKDIIDLTIKNKSNVVSSISKMLNLNNIKFNKKIKNLSDGQKQKLKLYFFLSNEPSLIILDEFTNALDKKSCLDIYNFINEYMKTKNITIINITHNLTDLQYLNGSYFLMKDLSIFPFDSKEDIITKYIEG